MKNIILCEGRSDAILLSYYLNKVAGWSFSKKLTKNIRLPIRDDDNEEVSVYIKLDDELVIWAVGGQSNFNYVVPKIIELNKGLEIEESYNKIIILRDRDRADELNTVLIEMQNFFTSKGIHLVLTDNNEWVSSSYINDYEEANEIYFLPIIIPFDKQGALETFVLDAICEMGQEEKEIVVKSKDFISKFNLINYLNTQRLKIKGEFAVTLGTMFPQRTFTHIDEMLKNIEWEKYNTIQEGFKRLEEI